MGGSPLTLVGAISLVPRYPYPGFFFSWMIIRGTPFRPHSLGPQTAAKLLKDRD